MNLQRETTGTGADGIGGSIDLYTESSTSNTLSNQIKWKYTTASHATRTSQMIFAGINSAAAGDILTLNGDKTIQFNGYGAGTLTTDASGNITATSDIRKKTAITNSYVGLKEVLKLQPINYKWKKESGFDTETTYTGFSAQNVKDVITNGTGVMPNGDLTLQDRALIAALVNAVKELQAQIDELKRQKD
jgi:hypothetical protein